MGALTSIPLCQRARGEEDGNNNLPGMEDRNLAQVHQVVEIQPEATSTPKLDNRRRIEPLPDERDLGDSSNSDSLESELEVRAVSERTFGSDSGLEQSGDELEVTREVEVHEEESMEDLNVALEEEEDDEDGDEPGDTVENLESGDLGVDRSTTFKVPKVEPPINMELEVSEDEFSEPLTNDEEGRSSMEGGDEKKNNIDKLSELGISEAEKITSMLSELSTGPQSYSSEMSRR